MMVNANAVRGTELTYKTIKSMEEAWLDCDDDGVQDSEAIARDSTEDLNHNGFLDVCEKSDDPDSIRFDRFPDKLFFMCDTVVSHLDQPVPLVLGFEHVNAWRVVLRIEDLDGNTRATLLSKVRRPGRHEVQWIANRSDSSGTYLARLAVGDTVLTRRITVLQ